MIELALGEIHSAAKVGYGNRLGKMSIHVGAQASRKILAAASHNLIGVKIANAHGHDVERRANPFIAHAHKRPKPPLKGLAVQGKLANRRTDCLLHARLVSLAQDLPHHHISNHRIPLADRRNRLCKSHVTIVDIRLSGPIAHIKSNVVEFQTPCLEHVMLAHLGANEMTEQMLDILAGEDVYIDTAVALNDVDEETFKRIVARHGEDKILFATDSPWGSIEADAKRLRSFSLGKDAENKIFYKNARALIGL